MIRSRKDESSTAATVATATKSSTVVGTPPPKRSSGATANTLPDHDKSLAAGVASPASISSSFAALSATSLQYYSQLAQGGGSRVRGTVKKKSSKKKIPNEGALWTQVQMPPRLLWSTMGIFLILPVLMFLWKETHIQSIDSEALRGKQYGGSSVLSAQRLRQKKQHREFVTWMAKQVAPEEEEDEENLANMVNDTLSEIDSGAETLNKTMDDGLAPLPAEWNAKSDPVLDVRSVGVLEPPGKEGEPSTAAEFPEGEREEEEDDTLEE